MALRFATRFGRCVWLARASAFLKSGHRKQFLRPDEIGHLTAVIGPALASCYITAVADRRGASGTLAYSTLHQPVTFRSAD